MIKGVDLKKIQTCIGDTEADEENAVLKAEQDAQVGLLGFSYDILLPLSPHLFKFCACCVNLYSCHFL